MSHGRQGTPHNILFRLTKPQRIPFRCAQAHLMGDAVNLDTPHNRQLGGPLAHRIQRLLRSYFAAIKALVISNMRLEKPHSLSYQASTLTKVPPVTLVKVES